MFSENDWRNDPSLKHFILYRKKFALFPVTCSCGTRIWLTRYYTKYRLWGFKQITRENDCHLHTDRLENITEAEYIVRKLAEGI